MKTERSELEVSEVVNTASDIRGERTSLFPDLTYEDGVIALFNWLFNNGVNPVEQ